MVKLQDKYNLFKQILKQMAKVVVAYVGRVDSMLLLKATWIVAAGKARRWSQRQARIETAPFFCIILGYGR